MPLYEKGNSVRYFRHALSLDEHRVRFIPTFSVFGMKEKESKSVLERPESYAVYTHTHQESSFTEHEQAIDGSDIFETDAKEVFFAGVHCGKYSSSGRLNTVTDLSFYRRWRRLCS
jgi:hypothetical protein